MIPKVTQIKLDALASAYAARLLANVRQVFGQPQYSNSGELEDSVKVVTTRATETESPVIILTYADQGFFLGYKNPQWTKLPDINELIEWGEQRGLDFGNIPGYTYGTAPNLSDEKKVERIIWAIAKNKRREDTWKPKKWKNAAKLGDLLKNLNADTMKAYVTDVENLLAESISEGLVLS